MNRFKHTLGGWGGGGGFTCNVNQIQDNTALCKIQVHESVQTYQWRGGGGGLPG